MPIETCFYCRQITVTNLWEQACEDCIERYVKPLRRAGVEFKPPYARALGSYPPENWRELLEEEDTVS